MTYDADCFICGTPVQTFKAWECSINLRRRTMGGAFMTREGLYVCEKCAEDVLFPKPKYGAPRQKDDGV